MFDHIQAYHQPESVKEALRFLQDSKAALIAGGTDLALRADRSVQVLVDLSRLGLAYIKKDKNGLRIGAMTTMAALEEASAMRRFAQGIVAKAAGSCGSPQTRNLATIGGNLANASPAADTATPLLALDAKVVLQGMKSRRVLPLDEFFTGPHATAAKRELLIEVVLPALKPRTAHAFQRLARTEVDIAIVNAAAAIQLDSKGRCTEVRLALGAVAPVPMRARNAEAALLGQTLTAEAIGRAANAAAKEIQPIGDLRASAEYRREIARVLLRRAIEECVLQVEGGAR